MSTTQPNNPEQSVPSSTRETFERKAGKSVTLRCFDGGVLTLLCIGGALIALGASGGSDSQANEPTIEDIVVQRTGTLPVEEVIKEVRGLKPGQVYTHGREFGLTKNVEAGWESETGGSTSLSFFGLAGQSLEKKFAEELSVEVGHTTTVTEQISVNGDECPDHDIKVVNIFETAVVKAPKFSSEEIPIKVQVDVKMEADDLCHPKKATVSGERVIHVSQPDNDDDNRLAPIEIIRQLSEGYAAPAVK